MVNTATHVDGHTIAIPSQETQEADEPPIGGLKRPNLDNQNQDHQDQKLDGRQESYNSKKKDELVRDLPTAGSSAIDFRSYDGTLTNGAWDGNADRAHVIDATDIASYLEVDPRIGLSTEQAANRLERDGPNKVDGAGTVSIGEILLRQVSNSLTIVLVIAMALSYGTLDFIEGAVISAVIMLNIVLGLSCREDDAVSTKSRSSILAGYPEQW
jgi:Na+-exporting ATPase